GDEERLPARLNEFLSSCGPAACVGVRISGLGDADKIARARAQALSDWRDKFPLGLGISLELEKTPDETGDMTLYSFMRKMQERTARAKDPQQLELERRVLAAGWRALTGMRLDPEDLLERK
ncbi:MAG TPA: hypothetical protein PLL10_10995, partial [Elusimicrobiales bacterium]|nr:hypothetical protein [Elusimicrobiales bacterium]